MPEGADLFEIIHTTRAMRRLKPDPVPDELIRKILLAGQAAASGGNTQRWRFLVLKDPAIKKAVQVYYKKAFDEVHQKIISRFVARSRVDRADDIRVCAARLR